MVDLNELNEITNKIKEHIKKNTSDKVYELWFMSMTVLKMTDLILFVSVDTEIRQLTIESRYRRLVTEAVKQIYDKDLQIVIYNTQYGKIAKEKIDADEKALLIKDEKEKEEAERLESQSENEFPAGESDERETGEFIITNRDTKLSGSFKELRRNFKPEYTFDNFVVGSSNRFAYTACTVVAQYPAVKYNPLFIHGPSGLGKTHLLYAIANEYAQKFRNAVCLYTTGEEFTNQLINNLAISDNTQKQQFLRIFREKYRNCDMLLIDDIQFIAGKNSTQEEFFHTYNTLQSAGKQIILTSDRPPKEMKVLEERLTSRFESGLIADIQPPDLELRIAILKRKAEDTNIKITNEVLFFIAENVSSNIRQMEGVIKKLNAYAYLNNSGVITLELAKACIADILSGTEPINVTVEKVLGLISQTYGVPQEELKGRKRTKEIAFARNVAIYIIRKITDLSLPATGRFFDRNHSTIYSAITSIETEIKTNSVLNNQIEEIAKLAKG